MERVATRAQLFRVSTWRKIDPGSSDQLERSRFQTLAATSTATAKPSRLERARAAHSNAPAGPRGPEGPFHVPCSDLVEREASGSSGQFERLGTELARVSSSGGPAANSVETDRTRAANSSVRTKQRRLERPLRAPSGEAPKHILSVPEARRAYPFLDIDVA